MFNVFGSCGLGAHSNAWSPHENPKHRRTHFDSLEIEFLHGPVKVLVEGGTVLPEPRIVLLQDPEHGYQDR